MTRKDIFLQLTLGFGLGIILGLILFALTGCAQAPVDQKTQNRQANHKV